LLFAQGFVHENFARFFGDQNLAPFAHENETLSAKIDP